MSKSKGKRKKQKNQYPGLSNVQVDFLTECFELFDSSQSGIIEKRELPFAMSAAGWKPEKDKIQEILDSMESSNTVNFDEYVQLMTPIIKDQNDNERFRVAFTMFDSDNKGYITIDDLKRVSKEIGGNVELSELTEMIKEAGNNNKVTFDNFVTIMQFTEDSVL